MSLPRRDSRIAGYIRRGSHETTPITVAVGQVTETETGVSATPVTPGIGGYQIAVLGGSRRRSVRSTGYLTGPRYAVTTGGGVPVGTATETETGLTATARKVLAVGQVVETEIGQATTAQRIYPAGQATEIESGLAATSRKVAPANQITEIESGLGITTGGADLLARQPYVVNREAIEQANRRARVPFTFQDSGPPTVLGGTPVGQTTEVETGLTITPLTLGARRTGPRVTGVARTVAQQYRTSRAFPRTTGYLTRPRAQPPTVIAIGQTVESELAQPITSVPTTPVGQTVETETGFAITSRKIAAIAQVTETESGLGVAPASIYPLGFTTETEQGLTAAEVKARPVTQSVETETALFMLPAGISFGAGIPLTIRDDPNSITVPAPQGIVYHENQDALEVHQ